TADIPALTHHFIRELSHQYGKAVDGITRDALEAILAYSWPGNIRELRNAIEHAMVTVSGDRIELFDLPMHVRGTRTAEPTPEIKELSPAELEERDRIVAALEEAGGNRTQAAKILGTSRVTLWKKMSRYGLQIGSRKGQSSA
ncbi:MAG TPA: hypothetical protein ENJ50_02745, partial [Planctomycetaceae bacterium]|nr:hypothetical protein [Planctomycetaceae bacterium]